MTQTVLPQQALSKYPTASLRELAFLSLPLILSLLSVSLMGFCDKIFLARYSLHSMEAGVSASYLCHLFQFPIMRVATMAQVFAGLYYGSKSFSKIGPATWQMIWLSIFSMVFTLPISRFVAPYFFGGTSVEGPASTYFHILMFANFLFPLSAALSSYFIGQGRMSIIFYTNLLCHGLNIGLDYLFIFGIDGILPPMGIFGAAIATAISQLLLCIVLFWAFLRKKERLACNTHDYRFNGDQFWRQFRVGFPRAIARAIILTAWVSTSRLMTLKGGDYLMVLSVGGTLALLFTFINEGMMQGMITIASSLMGSKNYGKIWKLLRSSLLLLGCTSGLLLIPYLLFPGFTLSFFFPGGIPPHSFALLKITCIWLWLFFICNGVNAIGHSLMTSSRDLNFYMISILFVWCTSYLPVYLGMNFFGLSSDKLWLIMAFDNLVFGILFIYRTTKEKWKEREKDFELDSIK